MKYLIDINGYHSGADTGKKWFPDFIQYFPDFSQTKFFKISKCERYGSLNPRLITEYDTSLFTVTLLNEYFHEVSRKYTLSSRDPNTIRLPMTTGEEKTSPPECVIPHKVIFVPVSR